MAPDYDKKVPDYESSRVRKDSQVRQEIPEEGRRAYQPKRCTDNNEDEDNSPNNTDKTK